MLFLLSLAFAADPPNVVGTWSLQITVGTKVVIPVIGGISNWTTTMALVTIRSGPSGLVQTQTVCSVTNGSKPELARTILPPSFVKALPVRVFPVSVTETKDGWRFLADPGEMPVGFNPRATPIPTTLESPGILDFEGDGHPGATVQVEVPVIGLKGDVWVVQNGHTVMRAGQVSDDYIRGNASVILLEQHTLGATHPWLTSNPKVQQDPANSFFEMKRLPEGSGCSALS